MVGVPPSVTVSESRLPPPEAVVAVARILLVPVASVAVSFALWFGRLYVGTIAPSAVGMWKMAPPLASRS